MQALKLFLLLGIVTSTVFVIHQNAFAQTDQNGTSSDATASSDNTTDDTNSTQDNTANETTDNPQDDAAADNMADNTMNKTAGEAKEFYGVSPLQQLISGTDPHQIQCGTGLKLVFKATDFRPACVKESTSQILLQRGWQSSHDPSTEEMTDMMSKLPKPIGEKKDDVKMDEKMNMDEQTAAGNNTNTKPQNHTISLSESMEMGAQ